MSYTLAADEPYTLLMDPPSGGDDGPAIEAAMQAAVNHVTGIGSGSNTIGVCKIRFRAATYIVSTALHQTSGVMTWYGYNAQIRLPLNVGASNQRVVLILEGAASAASIPTTPGVSVPQNEGTIIKSTLTGCAWSDTYKQPSMIGGPTLGPGGFDTFDNLLLCMRGITFRLPTNPSLAALDLSLVGHFELDEYRIDTDAVIVYPNIHPTTHVTGIGLIGPVNNNPGTCYMRRGCIASMHSAMIVGEHLECDGIYIYGCEIGIGLQNSYHATQFIGKTNIEKVAYGITFAHPQAGKVYGGGATLMVDNFDFESDSDNFVAHVWDPAEALYGEATAWLINPEIGDPRAATLVKVGGPHFIVNHIKTSDTGGDTS